jgi:hypothetical protein
MEYSTRDGADEIEACEGGFTVWLVCKDVG